MDIGAVKTNVDQGSSAYGGQTTSNPTAASNIAATKVAAVSPVVADKADNKPAKVANLQKMTAAMNQFVESLDTNIRFKFHEKTQELIVQVVDQTNDKVLREMPSQEFLDTIATIRSVLGMMLDKKM